MKFKGIYKDNLDKLITMCYNYREFGCSADVPKEITDLLNNMLEIAYNKGLKKGRDEGYRECFK